MTDKLREAAQQALEALMEVDNCTYINDYGDDALDTAYEREKTDAALTALRTALAEQPAEQESFGYFNNPALDGWQDCAPDDEGAIALYEAPSEELAAFKAAIRKLHAAKGRYHTHLAFCDLCDLVGLPCERPKK